MSAGPDYQLAPSIENLRQVRLPAQTFIRRQQV